MFSGMEITRQFNGLPLTITLTPDELRKAYTYQQQLYDEEGTRNVIDHLIEEGSDYPGEFMEAMQQHAGFINDTVSYYRNKYNCGEPAYTYLVDAVTVTLAKYYPQWKEGNS